MNIFGLENINNNKQTIICDIDSTLANINHRLHIIQADEHNWDEFQSPENIMKDTVNDWCLQILKKFGPTHNIVLLTARQDNTAVSTLAWLKLHNIPFHALLMRESLDHRPSAVVKKDLYKEHLSHLDILFVLDDHGGVIKMFRGLGIPSLQCDSFNY